VQITPTGEILYKRAKQIIAIYEQAKEDILEHHNSVQGELIIGASFTIGEYILPSLLSKLQKDFPALELQIIIGNTHEIVESVRSLQVDIGLIEGQTNDTEVSVHPFMEDELFIIASNEHPLASKGPLGIADLQNQAWVSREQGSGTREYLNHVIRSTGLTVKSLITISSNQGIKESVIQGMGLSLLSHSVIEREVKNGDLSVIPIKDKSFTRTLSYVFSPIMKHKRSVESFINLL
jgi:DNA-binding transcriptional LysR family regulator